MDILDKNKKAYYDYHVLDKFTAGIQLIGSEIKPTKHGYVSIKEAYCYIKDGEVFIKGMHIATNLNSNKYDAHDPYRERKLLLNKKEIRTLEKGIKNYDKRETIKKRDQERDYQRKL
jgi:SsrA-binding protein